MQIYRTEYHPELQEEGAIDPLGLAQVAERLALHFLPGLLERQRRIRFLTAVCVGLRLKDEIEAQVPEELQKADYWEAFEWNVVSGLASQGREKARGVPGGEKALTAMAKDVPLNADRYLMASSVFGFHGVYKFLAISLNLETQLGSMGENAGELMNIWAKEQKVSGLLPGEPRTADSFLGRLAKATGSALKEGHVKEKWSSVLWKPVIEHLRPTEAGKREKEHLYKLISLDEKREEVIHFLTSAKASPFRGTDAIDERKFYSGYMRSASPEMKRVCQAILAYEEFARTLVDAFESILYLLSQRRNAIPIKELAELDLVKRAAASVEGQLEEIELSLGEIGFLDLIARMSSFAVFREASSTEDFVELLLAHHVTNQEKKPPRGKNPWLQRTEHGEVMIRSGYVRDELLAKKDRFVHGYRAHTLRNFMNDLGK
jgi:hypothetical protein